MPRARAFGIYGIVLGLAGAAGFLLGGILVTLDLALLSDAAFMRGLVAVFFFFFANQSFYLVMTMFMQKGPHIQPLQAGLVFLPLALTFVIASRHGGARAKHRGTLVLIEGCAVQMVGLAALMMSIGWIETPSAMVLALVLTIFGYGQGLVMAHCRARCFRP
jgi:hypothetical protein